MGAILHKEKDTGKGSIHECNHECYVTDVVTNSGEAFKANSYASVETTCKRCGKRDYYSGNNWTPSLAAEIIIFWHRHKSDTRDENDQEE